MSETTPFPPPAPDAPIGSSDRLTRGLDTLGHSGQGRGGALPAGPRPHVPDLPWAYEDDRVVLLVRDPRTLFVYWDFHPDTVRRAFEGLDAARTLLRVLMLGGSEPRTVREQDVDLGWRAFYVYELEPNRDYRIELVAHGADGREQLIGHRSNVATLPPNSPSAWVEDRFASIPLDIPLPAAGLFAAGRLSAEGAARLHAHAFELSGGLKATGDEASSTSTVQGFGGRFWSGTLVRK